MKKFALLMIVVLSLSFLGCGGSSTEKKTIKAKDNTVAEVKTVEKKERKLPEGYPEELVVPFDLARRMTSGSGTGSQMINENGSMSFGKEQTFKSYSIWESRPKNVPEIISHYKKLMTDLEYEGEWKGNGEDKAYGVFKKGENELELHISEDQFKFGLKIWGAK